MEKKDRRSAKEYQLLLDELARCFARAALREYAASYGMNLPDKVTPGSAEGAVEKPVQRPNKFSRGFYQLGRKRHD